VGRLATGCNQRIRAEIDGRFLQLGGEYLDMFQVCFVDFQWSTDWCTFRPLELQISLGSMIIPG
jgi:hypothetical protein